MALHLTPLRDRRLRVQATAGITPRFDSQRSEGRYIV